MSRCDVVIVGGGQAGISLSYFLKQRQIEHVVVEQDRPFSAWRKRWEGFHANTPYWLNTLPMMRKRPSRSGKPKLFATRDELVEYLDDCLRVVDPPILTGVSVSSAKRSENGDWTITAGAEEFHSRALAVCTGAMSAPFTPETASSIPADVPQLHSSAYQSPDQITTGRVLLVGSGSSGIQICRLLCESGKFDSVHLATSKVLVLPRHVAGIQTHRLIHSLGLFDVKTQSMLGRLMYSGLETRGDPIMRPGPEDLRQQHGVELYGRLVGVEGRTLHFADERTLTAEDLTIIWCTGFRPDFRLVKLEDPAIAFHPSGHPRHTRGVVDAVPGLFFVGLRYQSTVASHDIYGVGKDAEHVAGRIAEHLSRGPKSD